MSNNNGNNATKTIGIIIMVIGLAIAIYTGFNDVTDDEVADVRAVQLMTDRENDVNWGPYAGIGLLVIGGVVYFAGRKKIVTQTHNPDNKNLHI